jgi:SpoVK/Ycf46/Vps4 family AAA+-type ATPase
MLTPFESEGDDANVPPCPECPRVLSTQPKPTAPLVCGRCGALRATLYEIEPEKLKVPDVSFADFKRAARKTRPSVAPEELDRFTQWTEEFGQEG